MNDFSFTSVFIIGCGYTGQRLARLWLENNVNVTVMARSDESEMKLSQLLTPFVTDKASFSIFRGDLDDDDIASLPTLKSLIYYLAPPLPSNSPTDTRINNFLKALHNDNKPTKIIYMSTTGVYGDCKGAQINEDTPINPQTVRAQKRAYCENILKEWIQNQHNIDLIILRVAGIYGPDRMPWQRLRDGLIEVVVKEEEAPPSNRIHVDDLATVCVNASLYGKHDNVYNVCDGQLGSMTQYFFTCADILNVPRPREVTMEEAKKILSPMMLSFLNESRRVDNSKMINELKVSLKYTNFLEGAKSCQ